MKEVKQSFQQEKENYKAVFSKTDSLQSSKRVHKWRDTETYHADCRRDYRQTDKYRQFY